MSIRIALITASLVAAQAAAAPAFAGDPDLAGAPMAAAPGEAGGGPAGGWTRTSWEPRHERRGGECWAQVKYPARFAPPPSGPEYVWTRQPGPPGSPGPIWCLTVQSLPGRPILVSPERLGWVRVLCADEATAPRIADVQRQLNAHGYYRGQIDGRYDEETAYAVRRFQSERHIEHRGYLSYETLTALDAPPPRRVYPHRYTTFETGYVSWPGKVRY